MVLHRTVEFAGLIRMWPTGNAVIHWWYWNVRLRDSRRRRMARCHSGRLEWGCVQVAQM